MGSTTNSQLRTKQNARRPQQASTGTQDTKFRTNTNMTIIRRTEADVEAKHPAEHQHAPQQPADNQAAVESIAPPAKIDVSHAGSVEGSLLLAKELKERISFQALLEADGHKFDTRGHYAMCRCPFHADGNPSFSIRLPDDTHGKCFGCDWYGDIFAYEMKFHRIEFKEAWLRLNDFVKQHPRAGRKAKVTPKREIELPLQLSERQISERKKYTDRLATDRRVAERICQLRYERSGECWNPDTLQNLAREGSLGWAGDALAFLYPTGTKYRRWPHKDLLWDGCTFLWRGELLPAATDVYLTEGETDAISLIDSGIEQTPGNLVVAAPSATTFKKEWAERFEGKSVTLCFDNDKAGENAVQAVSFLLKPYAKAVLTLDWKEVA